MSPYTVIWHGIAEQKLAKLWLDSLHRRAIREAADAIDLKLSQEHTTFEHVDNQQVLALRVHPLIVLFRIDDDDCKVIVLDVRFDPSQC